MSSILSLGCPRHHSRPIDHLAEGRDRHSGPRPGPSTPFSIHFSAMNPSFLPCLLAVTLIAKAPAADHTATWNGSAGNWSDATKWSIPSAPGTFPNNGAATYDAVMNNGSLTVDVPAGITLQKFSIGRGTLTATNPLTLNELLTLSTPVPQVSNETLFTVLNGGGVISATGGVNWSAATRPGGDGVSEISGASTALVNGRTQATDVIQVTGGMTLHGPGVKSLNRRAMNHGDGVNTSTVTWSEGRFSFSNNATFTNKPTPVFDNSFNGDLRNLTGTNYFINEGTFTKSAGTGNTDLNIVFDNKGTVNVNTGTLRINGGGTQTGTFNVPLGSTLQFQGSHALNAGVSFTGGGLKRIISGTTTANAPVTFNEGSIDLAGGTLNGPGAITTNCPVTWAPSTISGSSAATDVIHVNNTLFIGGGTGQHFLTNRSLNTAGTTTWNTLNAFFNNNGIINNTGSWSMVGSNQIMM
jgi:hypothetical protein